MPNKLLCQTSTILFKASSRILLFSGSPELMISCRFYSFIRSTDFPSTFPHFLPDHVLSSHILFPSIALASYLLALLLNLLYRFAYHTQKAIPTNATICFITKNLRQLTKKNTDELFWIILGESKLSILVF